MNPRLLMLFVILMLAAAVAPAQGKPRGRWTPYATGVSYFRGNVQYFDSYDYEILYSNSRGGLPIYSDWNLYSPLSTRPSYFMAGGWVQFSDTAHRMRLRISAHYSMRSDTLLYTGAYGTTDVVYVRTASETAHFGAIGVSLFKSTRPMLKRLVKLYGGGEAEFAFSPSSRIDFREYKFDASKPILLDLNGFRATGKARFLPFFSAFVGMEFSPVKWMFLSFEARSGIGLHMVVNEKPIGVSRTLLMGGLGVRIPSRKG